MATLVARNVNKKLVAPGEMYVQLKSGVRGSVCVGAFARNLASVAVKTFFTLNYFLKKFYRLCISLRFEKKYATVSLNVQHKRAHSRQR
jgi:hypothetical protein